MMPNLSKLVAQSFRSGVAFHCVAERDDTRSCAAISRVCKRRVRLGYVLAASVCLFLLGQPVVAVSVFAQEANAEKTEAEQIAAENIAIRRGRVTKLSSAEVGDAVLAEAEPWDFDPYRVLVWIVSDSPKFDALQIETPLREYLDRDFRSIWRMDISDAPDSITALVRRDIDGIDFDQFTAADPVIAVKRDHEDIIRIRFAENLPEYVKAIHGTPGRIAETQRLASDKENYGAIANLMKPVDGDALAVEKMWADENVEALLVSRGMANGFENPKAKLIAPPIDGSVINAMESYDKIFMVRINATKLVSDVTVVEIDTLMHFFGPPISETSVLNSALPQAVGRAVTNAFGPVMRVDEAGTKSASGLIRAGGLIQSADSPAWIRVGDVLQPMVRKNDRNGRAISIGPIDWAYLLVLDAKEERLKEWEKRVERAKAKGEDPPAKPDESKDKSRGGVLIEMAAIHAGRAGGLQGRKNNRTFRTAIKVRPVHEETMLRLHAKGDPTQPLIGYEVHEKELDSRSMTFIGRTDWNGRMVIEKNDAPMRLFYVKNGGAVLARLPIVPGLIPVEVADIAGDDMRLQAEAYIRGVQNAVIDLLAIRQLLQARIRMRIEKGQIKEAEDMLNKLREHPTHEILSNDMGDKLAAFKRAIGRNVNQQRKVDEMFSVTRELLTKHINPAMLRNLEAEMVAAKSGSGSPAPETGAAEKADE